MQCDKKDDEGIRFFQKIWRAYQMKVPPASVKCRFAGFAPDLLHGGAGPTHVSVTDLPIGTEQ